MQKSTSRFNIFIMSTVRTIFEQINTMLILSFQIFCFFFLNLLFGSNLVITLFAFKICFEHYSSLSLFGFYIFFGFCVYIFMFIILIILICSCCCCFCCWSFFQCIMVTICCCSQDIGLWLMARSKGKCVFHNGETDVSTPCAAFATCGADRGSS